jgi:hypothetical protein
MWLLVRDAALDPSVVPLEPGEDGGRSGQVLAACPDTEGRGDDWRWSIRRVGNEPWQVHVEADPQYVVADHSVVRDPGERDLVREPGEELVVVAIKGQHLVQDASGPWHRWLEPGDVFVVEGEESEHLVLTASGSGEASVIHLRPTGRDPLRWVP